MSRQPGLVLVAVFFLSFTSAASKDIWNSRAPKLTVGNDYVFQYDAQLLTGVPTASWHFTGYRLQTQVMLSLPKKELTITASTSIRDWQMRLTEIRFLKMNGSERIPVGEPSVFLPVEMFQPMSSDFQVEKAMTTELERPLLFRWQAGQVSRVQVHTQDPVWSLNIKKGILNMLHFGSGARTLAENGFQLNGGFRQSAWEEGIEGRCQTLYHWNRLPVVTTWEEQPEDIDHGRLVLQVVKSRDLTECLDASVFEHSPVMYKDCEGQELNISRTLLHGEVSTRANITFRKDTKEFLPWTVLTEARYIFPILNVKREYMGSFVMQNLTFLEARDSLGASLFASSRDAGQGDFRPEDTLRMAIFRPEMESDKNNSSSPQILTTLDSISEQLELMDSTNSSASLKYVRLLREWIPLLRQAPKSVLIQIHDQCKTQSKLCTMYHDLLPFVATAEAVEVLLEKSILAGRDKDSSYGDDFMVANRVRNMALWSGFLQAKIIQKLIQTTEMGALRVPRRKETLKALILSIGAVSRNIAKRRKPTSPISSPSDEAAVNQMALRFYQRLTQKSLPQFTQEELLILVCKGLGNLGFKESLPLVRDLIYERNTSVAVRVEATYVVRKLASKHRGYVQRLLLPNVYDLNQHVNVRIASYLMVMKTMPSEADLTTLVEAMRRDPVEHMRTFVMSHLRAVADGLAGQCDSRSAVNISKVLESADFRIHQGWQKSRIMVTPLWRSAQQHLYDQLKVLLYTNTIWSQDDFLPQSADLRLLTQFSGIANQLVEVGVRTEGLQKLLASLIGPNGALYKSKNAFDLLRQLNLQSLLKEVNVALYLNLFGEELAMWSLADNMKNIDILRLVQRWSQVLNTDEGVSLNWSKTLFMDHLLQIPTSFGVAFQVNHTGVFHVHTQGQLNFNTVSEGTNHKSSSAFHATVTMRPKLITEHFVEGGLDIPGVARTFSQIRVVAKSLENTQLKINARLSPVEGVRVHMEMPQQEQPWELIQWNVSMGCVHALPNISSPTNWTLTTQSMHLKIMNKEPLQSFMNTFRSTHLKGVEVNLQTVHHHPEDLEFLWNRGGFLQPMSGSVSLGASGPTGNGLELHVPPVSNRTVFNMICSQTSWKDQLSWSEMSSTMNTLEMKLEPHKPEELQWYSNSRSQGRVYQDLSRQPSRATLWILRAHQQQSRNSQRISNFTAQLKFPQSQSVYTLQASGQMTKPPQFQADNPLQIHIQENNPEESAWRWNFTLSSGQVGAEMWKLLEVKMSMDYDKSSRGILKALLQEPQRFPGVHPEIALCSKELAKQVHDTPACRAAWLRLNAFNRFNVTILTDKMTSWISPSLLTQMVFESDDYSWTSMFLPSDVEEHFTSNETVKEATLGQKWSLVVNPVRPRFAKLNLWLTNGLRAEKSLQLNTGEFPLMSQESRNTAMDTILSTLTEDHYPATCQIDWKNEPKNVFLRTFDRLFYNVSVGDWGASLGQDELIRAVLVQDVQSRFQLAYYYTHKGVGLDLILGPKVATVSSGLKRLTVVISDSVGLMLNGNTSVSQLPLTKFDENGNVVLHVNNTMETNLAGKNERHLTLRMPLLGLEFVTNLQNLVTVHVSPFYHSEMRGFCGDFDGETHQDLKDVSCRRYLTEPSLIGHHKIGYVSHHPVASLQEIQHLEQKFFLPLKKCAPRQQTQANGANLLQPLHNLP